VILERVHVSLSRARGGMGFRGETMREILGADLRIESLCRRSDHFPAPREASYSQVWTMSVWRDVIALGGMW
jgi:hypothetical protein